MASASAAEASTKDSTPLLGLLAISITALFPHFACKISNIQFLNTEKVESLLFKGRVYNKSHL
jgi:hypothetical protein